MRRRTIRGQVAIATTPGGSGRCGSSRGPAGLPGGAGGDRDGRRGCCSGPGPGSPASAAPARAGAAPRRWRQRRPGWSSSLNLEPQPGETAGFSPGGRTCGVLQAPGRRGAGRGDRRCGRGRRPGAAAGCVRERWAPSWSWLRSPRRRRTTARSARCSPSALASVVGALSGRARPGTGRRRPPVTGPVGTRGRGRRHGDDRDGQGRAQPARRARRPAAARPRCRRCCASGRPAHRGAGGSSSRPSSTPARWRAGCAGRSARSTATPARSSVLAAGSLRRARATSSGSPRTARRWPGRPGWSTSAAGRCAACRRGGQRRHRDAEAAWRGAFLAHGSLTEPGRSSSLEVTCPGPGGGAGAGRRGPPARHPGEGPRGARRRPGGRPRRRRDRRAAHPDGRARRRAGVGGAADAPRGAGHRQPAGQLRRREPAPLGPGRGGGGARVERALEILGDDAPEHLLVAGRLRLEHRQASLEELGQLRRPADDQGRRRRADPAAAGDGRQARPGPRHPGHRVRGHRTCWPSSHGRLSRPAHAPAPCRAIGRARAAGETELGAARAARSAAAADGCPERGRPPPRRSSAGHIDRRTDWEAAVTVRVGINGFGRIGRNFFRAVAASAAPTSRSWRSTTSPTTRPWPTCSSTTASWAGFPQDVVGRPATSIIVGGTKIKVLAERDPAHLPWGDLGVDVVVESTGFFTNAADAAQARRGRRRQEGHHLRAGQGRGPHHRHGRQRRPVRPGHAHDHLQRLLHDQLPRPAGQGARRRVRHRARPDDHDPRLHPGPEPAGRPAQGPAPGPRRRAEHRPDLAPVRPRRSAWCCPSSRASSTATRCACRSRPARPPT